MSRKARPRVLYLLLEYPQYSQTYIKTEINVLRRDYDIHVIALREPNLPDPEHHPHQVIAENDDRMAAAVRDLKPAIIHAHYLTHARFVASTARKAGIPFTFRTHSFDVIRPADKEAARDRRTGLAALLDAIRRRKKAHVPRHLKRLAPLLNDGLCLGVLTFPFTRRYLESLGISPDKLVDAPPVVDFDHFYNRAANANGVMNVGACIRKKKMEDFLELARRVPGTQFDLYSLGYKTPEIIEANRQMGGFTRIHEAIPFSEMPAVYKSHRWLVYTACPQLKTVGWPMAVAEAQASGTGVIMANIRPDLRDYVGEAGYLYDSIEDVVDIVRQPVPAATREAGFEQARSMDIRRHIHLLTDRWAQVL